MDADWIDARRRALQELYFEALVELGGCQRIRNDIVKAISTCEQVLLIDSYREEAHREIMRCYGQRGEVPSVLRQYQHLEALLDEELGVAPSRETTELMIALTSN
jgi:DNA-binding SARP family transcriptional activator